jgi:hypothetical protein
VIRDPGAVGVFEIVGIVVILVIFIGVVWVVFVVLGGTVVEEVFQAF